jgi:hypothetical protein
MTIQFVLLPVFVLVAVTFVVLFWTGGWRASSPPRSDIYREQFELPVLFYVLTIFAYSTKHTDILFMILAWIFVVLHVLRALTEIGASNISQRGMLYVVAAIVLAIMWVVYALRILLVI